MQKTIYSLPTLRELLNAANRRYLEFLSVIEDPRNGRDKLDKLSQPIEHQGRPYPGFKFFDEDDMRCSAPSPAASSTSPACKTKLCAAYSPENSSQVSRLLKRLRLHGLIKKIGRTYKYYMTQFGKQVITAGLKLRELVISPQLAYGQAV